MSAELAARRITRGRNTMIEDTEIKKKDEKMQTWTHADLQTSEHPS